MAFQRVNSPAAQFDEETRVEFGKKGDCTEGYYEGADTFNSKQGDPLTKHRLVSDDGEILTFLGNKILNDELAKVEKGVRVRVTFEGMATSKTGRKYKNYTIESDTDDVRAS